MIHDDAVLGRKTSMYHIGIELEYVLKIMTNKL